MSNKAVYNVKTGRFTYTEAPPLTEAEISERQAEQRKAEIKQKSEPMTMEEVFKLQFRQQANTLEIDDSTASRMADYFPDLKEDGSLVSAGTRINWKGQLKRAAVDLWDTTENNPDNAVSLWEDIDYRNGYRVIPETITAGTAFELDECGWWGDSLYQSALDANVWSPEANPTGWTLVEM